MAKSWIKEERVRKSKKKLEKARKSWKSKKEKAQKSWKNMKD